MNTIKGTSRIVGIFGDPVTYSLSPQMHNYVFEKLHLDFVYVPFVVRRGQVAQAVNAIRALHLLGVNVTIPHKETVIPHLDHLAPMAIKAGAVNTIVNHGGKLTGHNTDVSGFIDSLKLDGEFNPSHKKALIYGAGGVSRAMSLALIESGISKITILNRTLKNAKTLQSDLHKNAPNAAITVLPSTQETLEQCISECDLFINATPSGPETPLIPSNIFVFDAVYAEVTPLLIAAKKSGAKCLGGLDMLIRQGALAFSLWTGLEPPAKLMREALKQIGSYNSSL